MFKILVTIFFKLKGWKVRNDVPTHLNRCVILAAPHTSNWDFVYTMATFAILKLPIRFTIKKEWMRFPFSIITKPLGGIAIDRTPKKMGDERISYTSAMANLFEQHKHLIIIVTPEGSRSKKTTWKTGFYHIAKEAGVPICLGYCDYDKKIAGIGATILPTNFENDMKTIMQFYSGIKAKHPSNFSIDTEFK